MVYSAYFAKPAALDGDRAGALILLHLADADVPECFQPCRRVACVAWRIRAGRGRAGLARACAARALSLTT